MKNLLFFLVFIFLGYSNLNAQNFIPFQAQSFDEKGIGLPLKSISVKLAILKSSENGEIIYEEVHSTKTDNNGIFQVKIGSGDRISSNDFKSIDWSEMDHFIKISIDPNGGNNYISNFVTKFGVVPYALFAENASNIIKSNDNGILTRIIKTNNNSINTGYFSGVSTDFSLDNNNNGSNTIIGIGSGFNLINKPNTTSGINNIANVLIGTSAGGNLNANEYQSNGMNASLNTIIGEFAGQNIGSNSISNILIGNEAGRFASGKDYGNKIEGNIAIGNSAISYADLALGNVVIGISGFRNSKSIRNNIAVGNNIASSMDAGENNVFIGDGVSNLSKMGDNNVFLGYSSGQNINSSRNIAIGYSALKGSQNVTNNTGEGNVALGPESMFNNTSGSKNIAFGEISLFSNTTGSNNLAIGYSSLNNNSTGFQNIAIGNGALKANNTSQNNVAIGMNALSKSLSSSNIGIGTDTFLKLTNGTNNLGIGDGVGKNIVNGFSNIILGSGSDTFSESTTNLSNSVIIGFNIKVNRDNSVFLGNSSTDKWLFGRTTIESEGYSFQVGTSSNNGNGAYLTNGGTWTNASSINLKENFQEIDGDDLLRKITKLAINKWNYKGTNEHHIGPFAEDFKELFKLGIDEDDQHISTIDASGIALRAIQELIIRNDILRKENQFLKGEIEKIKDKINLD